MPTELSRSWVVTAPPELIESVPPEYSLMSPVFTSDAVLLTVTAPAKPAPELEPPTYIAPVLVQVKPKPVTRTFAIVAVFTPTCAPALDTSPPPEIVNVAEVAFDPTVSEPV